mmetsp:Transcript_2825/g.8295  ORF Transcript_2825/g.8295 Transcript_2825/m.8295 type:complete len:102 (-) Transcript_2825:2064-2369(-)
MPPWRTSDRWLPDSTMRPFSMTRISSALRTVTSRWAMTMQEREDCFMARSSASCTNDSLCASSALVASSKISSLGLRTSALARAMRCLWPPDSSLSVTMVW